MISIKMCGTRLSCWRQTCPRRKFIQWGGSGSSYKGRGCRICFLGITSGAVSRVALQGETKLRFIPSPDLCRLDRPPVRSA